MKVQFSFSFLKKLLKKHKVSNVLSLSLDRIFVENAPAAEKARSDSTLVGGIVNKLL